MNFEINKKRILTTILLCIGIIFVMFAVSTVTSCNAQDEKQWDSLIGVCKKIEKTCGDLLGAEVDPIILEFNHKKFSEDGVSIIEFVEYQQKWNNGIMRYIQCKEVKK